MQVADSADSLISEVATAPAHEETIRCEGERFCIFVISSFVRKS
jgi:hypothetical protein